LALAAAVGLGGNTGFAAESPGVPTGSTLIAGFFRVAGLGLALRVALRVALAFFAGALFAGAFFALLVLADFAAGALDARFALGAADARFFAGAFVVRFAFALGAFVVLF